MSTKTCLANTETVRRYVKRLRQADFTVEADWKEGTVRVKDNSGDKEVLVYWALQKDRNTWIVVMMNGPRIKWAQSDDPDDLWPECSTPG